MRMWPLWVVRVRLTPTENNPVTRGQIMSYLWLGIVLVVTWAVLWLGLKIATGFIHLVVIVGLALIIWGAIKRGARAIT
jgi:hypothetical protein